jgi:hypothetical protein
MNVTRELRGIVYAKTEGHCWYCGEFLEPFDTWQIDHQHPRSQGGADAVDNLVAACRRCNLRKNGRTIEQYRTYLERRLSDKLGEFSDFACDFIEDIAGMTPTDELAEFINSLKVAHGLAFYRVTFHGEPAYEEATEAVDTPIEITAQSEAVS